MGSAILLYCILSIMSLAQKRAQETRWLGVTLYLTSQYSPYKVILTAEYTAYHGTFGVLEDKHEKQVFQIQYYILLIIYSP